MEEKKGVQNSSENYRKRGRLERVYAEWWNGNRGFPESHKFKIHEGQ